MTSKRKVMASLASGSAREHTAVRVGRGRPREKTVPRNVPNVDYRAFAKHLQNVFRCLQCFLD